MEVFLYYFKIYAYAASLNEWGFYVSIVNKAPLMVVRLIHTKVRIYAWCGGL